jgi:hypothetical protein
MAVEDAHYADVSGMAGVSCKTGLPTLVVVNLVVKSPLGAISHYKNGLSIGADAQARAAIHADLVAEGVGFEPTVGSYPSSV